MVKRTMNGWGTVRNPKNKKKKYKKKKVLKRRKKGSGFFCLKRDKQSESV